VSEIEDYGRIQWNGRVLDGIIVQTNITQSNRIKGVRETNCFVLGEVDDDEFAMRRDRFSVQCGDSKQIEDWKIRREFKSLWNTATP
jgi:hypothetical protein